MAKEHYLQKELPIRKFKVFIFDTVGLTAIRGVVPHALKLLSYLSSYRFDIFLVVRVAPGLLPT